MSAVTSNDFAPLAVLIVDDEAPARDRLRDLLGDIADTQPTRIVGMAASGIEALALLERQPAARWLPASSPSHFVPSSIRVIGASAQANTAWKTRNSTAASSSGPSTGCSTKRSMRSLAACGTISSRSSFCSILRTAT